MSTTYLQFANNDVLSFSDNNNNTFLTASTGTSPMTEQPPPNTATNQLSQLYQLIQVDPSGYPTTSPYFYMQNMQTKQFMYVQTDSALPNFLAILSYNGDPRTAGITPLTPFQFSLHLFPNPPANVLRPLYHLWSAVLDSSVSIGNLHLISGALVIAVPTPNEAGDANQVPIVPFIAGHNGKSCTPVSAGGKSSSIPVVLIILAVVLILLAIGAAIWFILSSGKTSAALSRPPSYSSIRPPPPIAPSGTLTFTPNPVQVTQMIPTTVPVQTTTYQPTVVLGQSRTVTPAPVSIPIAPGQPIGPSAQALMRQGAVETQQGIQTAERMEAAGENPVAPQAPPLGGAPTHPWMPAALQPRPSTTPMMPSIQFSAPHYPQQLYQMSSTAPAPPSRTGGMTVLPTAAPIPAVYMQPQNGGGSGNGRRRSNEFPWSTSAPMSSQGVPAGFSSSSSWFHPASSPSAAAPSFSSSSSSSRRSRHY